MQEYLESSALNERKKKQAYLIKNIIEEGYDPEEFTEFLHKDRAEGENIDTWTIEELETMVVLFKRSLTDTHETEKLNAQLEELELSNAEEYIYAKRYKTAKKKKTILTDVHPYILIDSLEIKDGGLFSGKYIIFTISIPELEIKVRRTDTEFKWLHEYMTKEFPFTPLPPMMVAHDKTFDPIGVGFTKKYYEKFLNECVKHPDLKNSLSMEIFLVAQTKEEMAMRCKDIQTFFSKNVIIAKGFTKKGFDTINKDILKIFPTTKGIAELKISSTLKNYTKSSEGQYYHYETLFDRLDKLHVDYDKYHKKLMVINSKIKDTLSELQSTAIKLNSAKPFRTKFNIMEDTLFSAISAYFDNYDKVLDEQKNLYKKHIGDFAKYNKEYIANLRNIIDQRNSISGEYYKNKFALDERKYKKLTMDKSFWEIDTDLCKMQQMDPEVVKQNTDIAKRFMITEVC